MLRVTPQRAFNLFRVTLASSKIQQGNPESHVQAEETHHTPYAELPDLFFPHEVKKAEIPATESSNISYRIANE